MYGRRNSVPEITTSHPSHSCDASDTATGLEESMWQLTITGHDPYPERPGEPDCVYYMRTGFCGYGARCRYNHPHDRSQVPGLMAAGEEYPERDGQPLCQYYLKTGTCKFGATCKYHHPRHGGGLATAVSLNYYGYPLRPGEKECSYYVKTGQCKFGATCKFHHPSPSSISLPEAAPAFYPTVQSPVPSPQYGLSSWQVGRTPLLPGSFIQAPYGSVMLTPGVIPYSSWASYQSSSPGPLTISQRESKFPERPGEPECQFYMRTGDCKFGSTCRYHHPRDWIAPKVNCMLSPIGLPFRPGSPICTFYSQHGVCKFGPTCKFDHPMGALSYTPSGSSLMEMPMAPYSVVSSLTTLAPSPSEFAAVGSYKDFQMPTRMASSEKTVSGSAASVYSQGSGLMELHGSNSGKRSGSTSGQGQNSNGPTSS